MNEGNPEWWNSQAGSLDKAKYAVWSVPPDTYDATTARCVEIIRVHMPLHPKRLLDVGCGIGRLTMPMAEVYPDAAVYGVDVADKMLELARAQDPEGRVQWCHGDGLHVPDITEIDGAWTVVVFQHLEPHVCAALVADVAKKLAPGGRFVFQVIENVDFEDWGHLPQEVPRSWCENAGLEVVDMLHGAEVGLFPDWLWVIAEAPHG